MSVPVDRRTFLTGALAGAAGVTSAMSGSAQSRVPVTLLEFLRASRDDRARGVQACLDRIAAKDAAIQAWVQVAPQPFMGTGAFAGVPYAAKDIIETRGLSTAYGSPVYKGRLGSVDAEIVRDLRQRGAVLLGKTHTTAFAYRAPAPTRNPRNLAHTPGGSSAGSAAAVAADMVPLALGTQTRGSVIRPASYCGVTGFKASYGLFSLEGVLPLAAGLDTLGFFTHTAADMLAFWEALGRRVPADRDVLVGVPDPMPDVEPAMAAAVRDAVDALRRRGVGVRAINIASTLARLSEASNTVQAWEAARHHRQRYEEHGDKLAELADLVRSGLQMPQDTYDAARRAVAQGRAEIDALFDATPVILVPAAVGPAPLGLGNTGDPRMNAPWTALGTPAVSVPMPVGADLPLGLQLTARHGEDGVLLRAAVRVSAMLGA